MALQMDNQKYLDKKKEYLDKFYQEYPSSEILSLSSSTRTEPAEGFPVLEISDNYATKWVDYQTGLKTLGIEKIMLRRILPDEISLDCDANDAKETEQMLIDLKIAFEHWSTAPDTPYEHVHFRFRYPGLKKFTPFERKIIKLKIINDFIDTKGKHPDPKMAEQCRMISVEWSQHHKRKNEYLQLIKKHDGSDFQLDKTFIKEILVEAVELEKKFKNILTNSSTIRSSWVCPAVDTLLNNGRESDGVHRGCVILAAKFNNEGLTAKETFEKLSVWNLKNTKQESVVDLKKQINFVYEKGITHITCKSLKENGFCDIEKCKYLSPKPLETKEIDANILVKYSDDGGIIFYKTVVRTKGKSTYTEEQEIIFISNIEILQAKHHDVINKKIINKIFCKMIRGTEEFEFCIDRKQHFASLSTTIIEKFNVNPKWKSELSSDVKPLTKFIRKDLLTFFADKIKICNSTTHCGIFTFDKKTLVPLFPYNSTLKGDYTITELEDVEQEDSLFKEKLTAKQIINLKKTLMIINTLGKSLSSKNIICNILSLSLSSVFRVALFDLGIKLFPYVSIVGSKSEGKSQLLEFFVRDLWNTQFSESNEVFKGTGVRFKAKVVYTTRPMMIDEIENFHRNYRLIPIIKTGATSRLGAKISRGNRNGTISNTHGIRPIFMTANSFQVSESAVQDRLYVIHILQGFREKDMTILSVEDKIFLTENINTIGQAIIQLAGEDTAIVEEINKIFSACNLDLTKNPRDNDKFKILLVGEMLLKKIYALAQIDYIFNPIENIDDKTNTVINAEEEELESCMNKLLSAEIT